MNKVWYSNKTDTKSPDLIHQVLVFGNLDEIQQLVKTAGLTKIKDIFLQYPKKIYTASSLNFIKKFILHISSRIDEQKYLKYSPRNTG